jgi:methyl halide transferase
VAIHPSLRDDWGRQMNALIKPGGYLIALVYPLDPETNTGPPFYVRLEHYVKVLGECWEKVFDAVPAVSIPSHLGRERLVVWRKK